MSHNRNNKFILGVAMVCFMFMAIAIVGNVAAQGTDVVTYSCPDGDEGPTANAGVNTGYHCTRPDDYPGEAGMACRAGYTLGTDEDGEPTTDCELDDDTPKVYNASVTLRVWYCDEPHSALQTDFPAIFDVDADTPSCIHHNYVATQADLDRGSCLTGYTLVDAVEEERDADDEITVEAVPATCGGDGDAGKPANYDATIKTVTIDDPPDDVMTMPVEEMVAVLTAFVWSDVQGNDLIGHAAAPVRLFSAGGGVQIFYASGNEGLYATTISRDGGSFEATNPVNDQPVSVTTSGGAIMLRTAYDDGKAYHININADNSVTIISW